MTNDNLFLCYQFIIEVLSMYLNINVIMELILLNCQHMNIYTLSIKTMKEKAKKEVDIIPRTANLSFVRENISERNRKRGDKKRGSAFKGNAKRKKCI